jgi:hypothetical protein
VPTDAPKWHARSTPSCPSPLLTLRHLPCPAARLPRRAPAAPTHKRAPPSTTLYAHWHRRGLEYSLQRCRLHLRSLGRYLPPRESLERQNEYPDGAYQHGQGYLAQSIRPRHFQPLPLGSIQPFVAGHPRYDEHD